MHTKLIFKLHQGMKQLAPGSPECTKKALSYIKQLPQEPHILDIGSGCGAQTVTLLKECKNCRIVCVDIYRPFLDDLEKNVAETGFSDSVKTVCASMDNLPFEKESFDLVWAEGSVFIMGFSAGITYWKKFIKPGGHLALTDIIRITKTPSGDAASFWNKNYPGIGEKEERIEMVKEAGYEILSSFLLPESAWLNYERPLEENLRSLKEEYKGKPDTDILIQETENEINFLGKYNNDYGYRFFILKKKD